MARSPRSVISVVIMCIVLVAGTGIGVIYLHLRALSVAPTRTLPVPPTQTNCPKEGTARTAIIAPLVLGTHQNVVYLVNERQGTTKTTSTFSGTLQHYDTITGKKTVIVKTQYMIFSVAQLSADGQWIVFVASKATNKGFVDELQMVRIDGQGLQTLYCTTHKGSPATAIFTVA